MPRRNVKTGVEIPILQEGFQYVRNKFFPQWDRKHQWKIVLDPDLPSVGRCDSDKKLIIVCNHPQQAEDFLRLLIHEIAHAVGATGHGKKWQARFLKAADQADQIGRKELASAIRAEVEEYREPKEIVGAEGVYSQIYEYVLDTSAEVPYESVINTTARGYGKSPEELEKYYKKCKEIYERSVIEVREILEARKRNMERIQEYQNRD
jgi:hypothetical protein